MGSPSGNPVLLAPDLDALNAIVARDSVAPASAFAVADGTKGRVLVRKFLKDGATRRSLSSRRA